MLLSAKSVRSSIASKLENLPTGHSDRIVSMRLPLHDNKCLTRNTPADDKVIVLGDFNGRVGRNSEAWKGVLGMHGVGNCNDNSSLQLEFCAEQEMTHKYHLSAEKQWENNMDASLV